MRAQVSDLSDDVKDLQGLAVTVGRLDERMGNVEKGIAATRESVGKIRDALEERDKATTDERKAIRVALITLSGTIAAAIIAGVVAVLVAGMGSV